MFHAGVRSAALAVCSCLVGLVAHATPAAPNQEFGVLSPAATPVSEAGEIRFEELAKKWLEERGIERDTATLDGLVEAGF